MKSLSWHGGQVTLHQGDCLTILRSLETASIDAVITDPPAGIRFMGQDWDSSLGSRDQWITWLAERMNEAARVLKPGAHALVWALPRTAGWTQIALEDAGFEIRDSISHIFGSGFPKSRNVSKAIDRQRDDISDVRAVCRWLRAVIDAHPVHTPVSIAAHFGFHPRMAEHWAARDSDSQPALPTLAQWDTLRSLLGFGDGMDAEVYRLNLRKGEPGDAWAGRPVLGSRPGLDGSGFGDVGHGLRTAPDAVTVTGPATDAARRWEGWGTTLKPAHEIWWLARKPLAGTVAQNVLEYGTGALNVNGCRVGSTRGVPASHSKTAASIGITGVGARRTPAELDPSIGRWPPNVLLSHAAGCVQAGTRLIRGEPRAGQRPGRRPGGFADVGADAGGGGPNGTLHGDQVMPVFDCVPSCPVAELDRQSGNREGGGRIVAPLSSRFGQDGVYGDAGPERAFAGYADSGGASRFFPVFRYEPKAATAERPRIAQKVMRLRANLTDEERAYVMDELRKAGVDAA